MPALENRIEHGRKIGQFLVALQLQMPSSDGLPHGLASHAADRRGEVHVNPAIFVQRLAGPERISQESELDFEMILLAIDILAVHDPCLVRMQFEAAFSEAFVNSPQHELRLRLTLAVDDRIIGVAPEPHARQSAIDPDVKSIVQEQICQKWRNDAALRRASHSRPDLTIRGLQRRFKPAFHIQQDPGRLAMLPHCPHQEIVIDIVEQAFDVEFDNPIKLPAPAFGDGDRVMR